MLLNRHNLPFFIKEFIFLFVIKYAYFTLDQHFRLKLIVLNKFMLRLKKLR